MNRRTVLSTLGGLAGVGVFGTSVAQTPGTESPPEFSTYTTDDPVDWCSVEDGTAYVFADNTIYALDPEDGSEEWTNSDSLYGSPDYRPLIDEEKMYFEGYGDYGGLLAAHNLADGSEEWLHGSSEFSCLYNFHEVEDIEPGDGVTFHKTEHAALLKVDRSDGSLEWVYENNVEGDSNSPCETKETWGSMVVGDGRVYVEKTFDDDGPDYQLYGVSTADGSLEYTYNTTESPVAARDGIVYLESTTSQSYIRALDTSDNGDKWGKELGGDPTSDALIVGDTMYFRTDDGVLYALDPSDGSEEWTLDLGQGGESDHRPTIRNGRLYIGSSEGTVYALDKDDGSEYWRYSIDDPIRTPIGVGEKSVVFGSGTTVYGIAESLYKEIDGKILYSYQAPQENRLRGTENGSARLERRDEDE